MKKLAIAILGLIIVIGLLFVLIKSPDNPSETVKVDNMINNEATNSSMNLPFPILAKEEIEGKRVRIETAKGSITFELYADSPIASSNFISLANKKFYDGLTFHRREEGFVIQGGDPNGNGTGGPGYQFPDETVTLDYKQGIVAMANSGPNTNGSQFFIMLADTPLPKNYTIFGNVVEGMDVVDKIKVGDVMKKVVIE